MARLFLAMVTAPVLWGLVSVPANLLLGEAYGDSLLTPPLPTDYLIVSLLLSFGYSLFAGWGAVRACRIGHPDPVHATRLGLAAGGGTEEGGKEKREEKSEESDCDKDERSESHPVAAAGSPPTGHWDAMTVLRGRHWRDRY